MRILLDVGRANVDALSFLLWTALHNAAFHGRLEAAAFCINIVHNQYNFSSQCSSSTQTSSMIRAHHGTMLA